VHMRRFFIIIIIRHIYLCIYVCIDIYNSKPWFRVQEKYRDCELLQD